MVGGAAADGRAARSGRRPVVVVGAGLAGLAAAVAAREHGADVAVLEAGAAAGGTTALSAGWAWRYRDAETARRLAPGADPVVAGLVLDRLDGDLRWLEGHAGPPLEPRTARATTVGVRLDVGRVVAALSAAAGDVRLRHDVRGLERGPDGGLRVLVADGDPLEAAAVVLATGGFVDDRGRLAGAAGIAPEVAAGWAVRGAGRAAGALVDPALALGARHDAAGGESYARLVPVGVDAPVEELARLVPEIGEGGVVVADDGTLLRRQDHDWCEAQLAWRLARHGGCGWALLDEAALAQSGPHGTGEQVLARAAALGARIHRRGEPSPPAPVAELLARTGASAAVRVVAGVTHTWGGFVVDERCRVAGAAGPDGAPLLAAGTDVRGSGLGGYASGLAQALVTGRLAGREAAAGTNFAIR